MVGKRGFFAPDDRSSSFAPSSHAGDRDRPGSSSADHHDHASSLRKRPSLVAGDDDLESGGGGGNKNNRNSKNDHDHHHDSSSRPRPKLFRFRDIARTALEDKRRDDLKRALLHGVDRRGLERFRKSDADLRAIPNRRVRAFYADQNERLNDWLEVDAVVTAIADDVLESMDPDPDHDGDMERGGGLQHAHNNISGLLPDDERDRRARASRRATLAININVAANVLLLAGKIVAALSTGSLSLVASLVDSALDLLCTLIIWSTNRLVQWRVNALRKRFPVGRRRLEPLGILVFSIIMVISFAQILQESVQKLMPLEGQAEMLSTTAIAALVTTIVLKGVIGLGCLPIKTAQVQALAQDCKTDVVFNTLSLLFPFIGYKADVWWLDPAGAGLLSLFIIYDWGQTCFENVTRLSGEAAPARTQQKLLYLAYRFSPVVAGIKRITAYHAGDGVWAEFDILLDDKHDHEAGGGGGGGFGCSLRTAHDVAETLQYCAEGLLEVDRAFVSTDYSSSGPQGHAHDAEVAN